MKDTKNLLIELIEKLNEDQLIYVHRLIWQLFFNHSSEPKL